MRITLDPWGDDHASQITVPYKINSADTSVLALDDPIEDRPWAPVVPAPPTLPTVTGVVDGVLRSDMTALVAEGEQQALALFGCDWRSSHESPRRARARPGRAAFHRRRESIKP